MPSPSSSHAAGMDDDPLRIIPRQEDSYQGRAQREPDLVSPAPSLLYG
jgi:hypothetical protein